MSTDSTMSQSESGKPGRVARAIRLDHKLGLVRPAMQAGAKRLFTHDKFDELFPAYLFTLHTTIRASVPLLKLAKQRCCERRQDPVAEILADYFAEHAEEESQHDLWLMEDIVSLGFSESDVLEQVPSVAAASMVGCQYYWIEHFHPVALLGYLAILERPVDPEYFRRLIQKWNIPESGFRTILLHAELDGDHRAELDEMMDRLPLTESQESMLGMSAIATAGFVAEIFNDVVDRFERR